MAISSNLKSKTESPLSVFIKSWGRMGVHWGVGKVVAEIQALLYVSRRPLSLDDISERLRTSRSNVSLNVRVLQDLGVARKVHSPGDRKDYYEAETDVQMVARRLAAAKKKREIDPALEILQRALDTLEDPSLQAAAADGAFDLERLRELQTLIQRIDEIFNSFIHADSAVASAVVETADADQRS